MKHFLLITICVIYLPLITQAQKDFKIKLKSSEIPTSEFYTPQDSQQLKSALAVFMGNYYVGLQFDDIPTISEREELASLGIQLLRYLDNYAYFAKVPQNIDFSILNVRAIIPVQAAAKLSEALVTENYPEHATSASGLQMQILPFPSVSIATLQMGLQESGWFPTYIKNGQLHINIPQESVLELAAHPAIMYLEPSEPKPVKEGQEGRNMHRVNHLNSYYDGEHIVMAIADDGMVFHLDFLGRIYDHTQTDNGNHGEMTVGLGIGCGNIDPDGIGMAPAAKLHLYDINNYPHIVDAPNNFLQFGTVITSTSYGEGCGGVYSNSAQSLDNQVYNHPQLLHVFSAGNSSGSTCGPYSQAGSIDGVFYGNITGGRKAAKHSIAAGNLFYNDELRGTSSRGPTVDGRIKPDICAFGQGNWTTDEDNGYRSSGGTSAASPVVAGTAALLYDAYKAHNNDQNPSSALIKATMLNTAEDLGRPGPDYDFGWGRLHGKRAIETIENQWHISGSLSHGGQNVHLLTLPQGVEEFRAMVYWLDPAGAPQAAKALVNDLDFIIRAPGGTNHRPWILSTAIHLDSLTKPAYPGYDRVNNMEQIRLVDPNAGTYELKVNGHMVPFGPQEYFIVYYYTTTALELTYPLGGDGLVPGETTTIRWDAQGTIGHFLLEYSVDNMQSWQTIANNVGGDKRFYDWQVPSIITEQLRVRIRRGTDIDYSNAPIAIIQVPQADFGFVNDNTARIYWAPVPGADSYDIYALGSQFMEVLETTQDTSFSFNIGVWEEKWLAVQAKTTSGIAGKRSIAEKYIHVPCENHIKIILNFDLRPEETSWAILGDDGSVVKSGGPYVFQTANSTLIIDECLSAGCYDFIIYDEYHDGMCCQNGNGSYTVLDQNDQVLASGGNFGVAELTPFCLEMDAPPLTLNLVNKGNVSCANGHNGWATVAASGGTGSYAYSWSNGAFGSHVSNLGAGFYSVTVNDGGSISITSFSILEPLPLSIEVNATSAICGAEDNGSATADVSGGTPPYTYIWNTGDNTVSIENVPAGNYSLLVTDVNGCSASASIFIDNTSGPDLTFYASDASCAQTSNGWAFVYATNGTGNYNIVWSDGTESALNTGLLPGTYSVTVTDQNDCESVGDVTIGAPPGLEVYAVTFPETCAGQEDGGVILDIEGGTAPYTVHWNGGLNGEQLDNLPPGSYVYTIQDALGCLEYGQIEIESASPIYLAISDTEATDGNNGSADLSVFGGMPPYEYTWSNGADTEDLSGLAPGYYSVTVTDVHGCETMAGISISDLSQGYCIGQGSNTNFEWIESVQIGTTLLSSGNNGGYLYHQNNPIELEAGSIVSVEFSPGFSGISYNEYWGVWIDLNLDGDFDDQGEEVLSPPPTNANFSAQFGIPADAPLGLTRMRVIMKYGSAPVVCGTYAYGEVEDIVIEITDDGGDFQFNPGGLQTNVGHQLDQQQNIRLQLFPNPAKDFTKAHFYVEQAGTMSLEVLDIKGRSFQALELQSAKGLNEVQLEIGHLPAGFYYLILKGEKDTITKPLVKF